MPLFMDVHHVESGVTEADVVEAPDAEAANRVHREAHGLVADEIFEVTKTHVSA